MAVVLASSALTAVSAQQTAALRARQSARRASATSPATSHARPQQPASRSATRPRRPRNSALAATLRPAPRPDFSARQLRTSEITEDEIKSLLVGKQLFLRGGYLDNDLSYNEHGVLVGHSPQGSYTLSAIQIDKVHLAKHKLELEGERFGLHFLGALPYEDPTAAVDRVNITPKKKVVKISIDRELVVKPKEKREKPEKGKPANPAPKVATTAALPSATNSHHPKHRRPPAPSTESPTPQKRRPPRKPKSPPLLPPNAQLTPKA